MLLALGRYYCRQWLMWQESVSGESASCPTMWPWFWILDLASQEGPTFLLGFSLHSPVDQESKGHRIDSLQLRSNDPLRGCRPEKDCLWQNFDRLSRSHHESQLRFSKTSMSVQTVLLRTTLTHTIILPWLVTWLLSSNHLNEKLISLLNSSKITCTSCMRTTSAILVFHAPEVK